MVKYFPMNFKLSKSRNYLTGNELVEKLNVFFGYQKTNEKNETVKRKYY